MRAPSLSCLWGVLQSHPFTFPGLDQRRALPSPAPSISIQVKGELCSLSSFLGAAVGLVLSSAEPIRSPRSLRLRGRGRRAGNGLALVLWQRSPRRLALAAIAVA